jgi:hypothetical protein
MYPKLIGIAGKKRSGKDTAAREIKSLLSPMRIDVVRFADPLKEFCSKIFGWTLESLDGPQKEMPDPYWAREGRPALSRREAMKRLGTEFGRECHPDVWIRFALLQTDLLLSGNHVQAVEGMGHGLDYQTRQAAQLVLITDVRFLNEARAIKAAGGLVVRLHRPQTETPDSHISEAELDTPEFQRSGTDYCDCSIVNDHESTEGLRTDLRFWLSHRNYPVRT